MNFSSNYYSILNLSPEATHEQVKKAYRELVRKFHPDKNPNNRSIMLKFEAINEAYEVLADPIKRKQYDSVRNTMNNSPYAFSREVNTIIKTHSFRKREETYYDKVKKPSRFGPYAKTVVLIVVSLLAVWLLMKYGSN